MKIIKLPNKKLRQTSEKVILPLNAEDEKIVQMMISYIDESQQKGSNKRSGIGIAAVQLGYLKRMFYVNVPKSELNKELRDFLINPKIISQSISTAALSGGEGCLSIDEKNDEAGLVHRKFKIVIKGYSYFNKQEVQYTKNGMLAIVFQHEMDHLDGKLYIDSIDYKNIWKPYKDEEII